MEQKRPPKRTRQYDGWTRNSRANEFQRSFSSAAAFDRVNHNQQDSGVSIPDVGRVSQEVQSAKTFAVQQAQKDGCTGSFKSFDSQFGNFLVPVIPSLSDLTM